MTKIRTVTYIGIVALLMACGSPEEVVEETHIDGTPKTVGVYEEVQGVRVKVKETKFYESGQMEITGEMNSQGMREGKWSYWYENGQTWSECEYTNGLKHGETAVYFENGQKRYSGSYMNDQKSGIWTFWDVQGNVVLQDTFGVLQ